MIAAAREEIDVTIKSPSQPDCIIGLIGEEGGFDFADESQSITRKQSRIVLTFNVARHGVLLAFTFAAKSSSVSGGTPSSARMRFS